MGKPENPEDFVHFDADEGIELYIAKEVLNSMAPEQRELLVSIQGYGRFRLDLDR